MDSQNYWSSEMLKGIDHFKPRKYTLLVNDQKVIFYIGRTGDKCKYQEKKACLKWDSNVPTQRRPMGCHFYPMSFWLEEDTLVFTKHCNPYLCKGESNRYTEKDLERDLNTFEKMCKEVKAVGFKAKLLSYRGLKGTVLFLCLNR